MARFAKGTGGPCQICQERRVALGKFAKANGLPLVGKPCRGHRGLLANLPKARLALGKFPNGRPVHGKASPRNGRRRGHHRDQFQVYPDPFRGCSRIDIIGPRKQRSQDRRDGYRIGPGISGVSPSHRGPLLGPSATGIPQCTHCRCEEIMCNRPSVAKRLAARGKAVPSGPAARKGGLAKQPAVLGHALPRATRGLPGTGSSIGTRPALLIVLRRWALRSNDLLHKTNAHAHAPLGHVVERWPLPPWNTGGLARTGPHCGLIIWYSQLCAIPRMKPTFGPTKNAFGETAVAPSKAGTTRASRHIYRYMADMSRHASFKRRRGAYSVKACSERTNRPRPYPCELCRGRTWVHVASKSHCDRQHIGSAANRGCCTRHRLQC